MAAAVFEPSLSTSAMRAPFSSADAPSMADSLPSVNFGFDDLRSRMSAFQARFDAFIEQGRKRVMEERNQFRINIAEMKEDQRHKQREIEILTLKSTTHQQTLAKESQETAEMHNAISSLTSRRDEQVIRRDALKSQIGDLQKRITAKREAQHEHARYLDSQATHNRPELSFWQDYLCMYVDGAGLEDRLKFTFTHINENDWEKEAWFELDTSSRDYRITSMKPKLEGDEVERLLDELNEARDLSSFFKGMRELFIEALK
ncbi:putative kinetochore protein spc25 protein [Neofusicoccum parvum]|uniref:Kinetochore protein SPC25 n=2 Tax=Neofusicoccum parvum TaxID=310453 RepID=R1EKX5_BOTPV|nr:putative kinetochore protein spc25 protein [Neofusicoccum parvum UCRNP2]GME24517.1 putative kinetochore protein spc25 protein [Neofusicoccum parvum]GME62147.1 putative kinetochore protein spc25 protein [Neofusicoccum parvum]